MLACHCYAPYGHNFPCGKLQEKIVLWIRNGMAVVENSKNISAPLQNRQIIEGVARHFNWSSFAFSLFYDGSVLIARVAKHFMFLSKHKNGH